MSELVSSSQLVPLDFSVVRDLRKRAGLTLVEVAERSGVSPAVLSKLERNQSLCEIETLYRLARAFSLSASDLLSLAESTAASLVTAERYRSGPFDFTKIGFDGIDCFYTTASAGGSLTRPEAHGDDYEICWVQSGLVRIRLMREQHTLGPGEALKFDAVLEHTYEVLKDAEVFIVHIRKTHRF